MEVTAPDVMTIRKQLFFAGGAGRKAALLLAPFTCHDAVLNFHIVFTCDW